MQRLKFYLPLALGEEITADTKAWLSAQRLTAGSYRTDLRFCTLHDLCRQRRVLQIFSELFAVVNSPPQEINQRFSLLSVLLVFESKNVGVTRKRIRVRSAGICNRD